MQGGIVDVYADAVTEAVADAASVATSVDIPLYVFSNNIEI
jgi:hypothetical protein